MHFTKLRLAGFKSFVDPAELTIDPGLTGIVGPNGCGKSNLVEALRWVMGESSARRMRGAEMDDVIFGGTSSRPARNVAEVALAIDNSAGVAPALFSSMNELEVVRRIDRGSGSDYRINGRLARARDVQILFADAASGAGSPALVGQGRVSGIINAKPAERRAILEEAAGIAGLHARRHEAELRLRAAEGNLVRLEDVLGAMENQLQALRKQVRQSTRYRNLSEQIRRVGALLLYRRWTLAQAALRAARSSFDEAESQVRSAMAEVAQLSSRQSVESVGLPELRTRAAETAALVSRLSNQRQALEAEERRIAESRREAERQLSQSEADLRHEGQAAGEARGALRRLAEESARLLTGQAREEADQREAAAALIEAREAAEQAERAVSHATASLATDEARRAGLSRQVAEIGQRLTTLTRRSEEQGREIGALKAAAHSAGSLDNSAAAAAAADEAVERARAESEAAEQAKMAADAALGRARQIHHSAEASRAQLAAEAAALSRVLAADADQPFKPAIDFLAVLPGYERALAAALGQDLSAALDVAAPRHWRSLPELAEVDPLPPGAEPLIGQVEGPDAFDRALGHIGLVQDDDQGRHLAATLKPGQTLVTAAGSVWRWDGLTVAAGAESAAAVRLTQRNRLGEVTGLLEAATQGASAAQQAFVQASESASEAAARERRARESLRTAFSTAQQSRAQHAKLEQAAAAHASRLAVLSENAGRTEADRAEVQAQLDAARKALDAVPDTAPMQRQLADLRQAMTRARNVAAERQAFVDRLGREAHGRRRRLEAIATEECGWAGKQERTGARVAEFEARAQLARQCLEQLAGRPAEIDAERQALLDALSEAERARIRAADELAGGERRAGELERQLKRAEAALADAREARARAEAAVGLATQAIETIRAQVAERVGGPPDGLAALAGVEPDAELPDEAALQDRLDKLSREREAIGPVNLRAETEVEEIEAKIAELKAEREDLISAIGRLRQGVGKLNREARERLLASFDTIDGHFQALFTTLFGGGRAHLTLVESDDPLEAGLEIMASPPGKKLQSLSLLSGGEQALTALALIFAMFRTNPAPICVLDEVDAPLDDANVDRFCSLLEEMAHGEAAERATRFLVVTHHRMTMARMDRLYGVTMAERGVSQLVSVDLHRAERMRATA